MSTPETTGASSAGLYSAENLLTSLPENSWLDSSRQVDSRPKLKVLLIQPPVQDFYDTDVRLQPIGLCYLKAAVKKHIPNVEIIIKDYHGGSGRRTVKIPSELQYLADYYSAADKSPFSTFHQYYH